MKIVNFFSKLILKNSNWFYFEAFKSLSSFLKNEIKQERDNLKHKAKLPEIGGFAVKIDGPNVTLTKNFKDEQ